MARMEGTDKERPMRCADRLHLSFVIALSLSLVLVSASPGWSQESPPRTPPSEWSPSQVLATVAAGLGTLFYAPFKAVGLCPGMALASGGSLAFTRGDRATAEYLLRVGCTGTYVITPEMVRGQQEFKEAGEQ
jgi:hypothetical protein